MSILDELLSEIKDVCGALPDDRKPSPNLRYCMKDIALSAFSVFFTQSPSFLAHQRQLERSHGTSNAQRLFQISQVPTDNHIRTIMDKVDPNLFTKLFRNGFERVINSDFKNDFTVLGKHILIALDGVQHCSSSAICCDNCNHKKLKNGETHFFHSLLGAVLCTPNMNVAIPLESELVIPQDGHEKQDCEREASKRWIKNYGTYYANKGAILLGDDIYSCEPICTAIKDAGMDFIFTCKPDSHKSLYDFIDKAKPEIIVVRGKKGKTITYRFFNEIPINGAYNFMVNWCSIEEKNSSDDILYKNAYATNLLITKENVEEIVGCGRTRWKIENEGFNTLKNHGYNFERNFGHGKQNLANVLAILNLLAYSFHTLAEFFDSKYKQIREQIKVRREFFEEIRTLTKYMVFSSWDHLFDTMLDSFKPPGSVPKKSH
jgi:hypothetical protein